MYKSVPKVNLTLIKFVIMVYELRVGTIRTYRNTGFLKMQF